MTRLLALGALAVIALACTDPQPTPAPPGAVTPAAEPDARSPAATPTAGAGAAPGAPASPGGERIAWTACGPGVECGSVEVPADYRAPGAGSIAIAVNVHRALSPGERVGYLLVNPGAPGGSGLELVFAARHGAFAGPLLERFDIVRWGTRTRTFWP